MDELQISGKRFISSRRVAKDNGYHTDYIGQLIRANKIKGQKVGRAWYVEADSFAKFLGEEVAEPSQDLAAQKSSDLLSETSSSHEVSAGQTFAPQGPASVAEVVPTAPAEVVAAPAAPAPEPTPMVVHVQPGYIPSVPFSAPRAQQPVVPIQQPEPVVVQVAPQPIVAQSAPVEVKEPDTFAIPLRKVSAASVGRLRYVSEEPSLPEIPRNERVTRQMPTLEAEEETVLPAAQAPVAIVSTGKSGTMRKLALVAVAAVAIFAISAVVSSGLFQTINIEAGNPASVGYTLHW